MNSEVVARLLRTALQMLGVYLAATGKISEGEWTAVSGAVMALATTGYTIWTSWNTRKVPV